MAELLYLAHRIPYPPTKGDKIRSWHFLDHLARHHVVHLGCFVDDPDDWRYREALSAVCAETCFEPLPRSPIRLGNLRALVDGAPISVRHYWRPAMARWVHDLMGRRPIDVVFAFSSAMAQYVLPHPPPAALLAIDFVDVDSDKWRQYAKTVRLPSQLVYAREGRTLLDYERTVARRFHAAIFVSQNEANLFRSLAPESVGKAHVVANGVDTDYFDPDSAHPEVFDGDPAPIAFVGAMDYWPNVDAVSWFVRDVLPRVRLGSPDATFWIVGNRPDSAVRRLGEISGVRVTGGVPDVRPYLAHARVVVTPLRIARGIQNKVLEAMAMGKAVVASRAAVAGLGGDVPRDGLVVADDVEEMAAACVRLLMDPGLARAMGCHGRRATVEHFAWPACLAALDRVLDTAPGGQPSRRVAP